MGRRRRQLVGIACLLGVLAGAAVPAAALACSIPIREVGPVKVVRSDLQRPLVRTVDRSAWRLDASWVSTRPRLSQFVLARGVGRYHAVTFPEQQALSLDARAPFDNGWYWFEDDDPDTPPCELVGKLEWQAPRIRVVQGRREIRIAATTQRTVGDRTGCVLGPDFGVAPCPNLTTMIFRLDRPIGTRQVVLEQFP